MEKISIERAQQILVASSKDLIFDESQHRYTFGGDPLTSATAMIDHHNGDFKGEYWANKKAAQWKMPAETVAEIWRLKNATARAVGSEVHYYFEQLVMGYDTFKHLSPLAKLSAAKIRDLYLEKIKNKFNLVATECRMFLPAGKIAGTFDLLLERDGKYYLLDLKTSDEIKEIGFTFMYPPFHKLPDCNSSHYSMQLSLYKVMCEYWGIPISGMYLIHAPKDGSSISIFEADDHSSIWRNHYEL